MTPREKASELVKKYYIYSLKGKESAMVAVDEIIEELAENADDEVKFMRIIYWETVKREINNL
jgi:hypothetical protein